MITDFTVVLCSCPQQDSAEKIATELIMAKLAACVNIQSNITSIYRWEGKLTTSQELLLIIKTKTSLFQQVAAIIQANHPYVCPEIIALPIEQGSQAYLAWLQDNCSL